MGMAESYDNSDNIAARTGRPGGASARSPPYPLAGAQRDPVRRAHLAGPLQLTYCLSY